MKTIWVIQSKIEEPLSSVKKNYFAGIVTVIKKKVIFIQHAPHYEGARVYEENSELNTYRTQQIPLLFQGKCNSSTSNFKR